MQHDMPHYFRDGLLHVVHHCASDFCLVLHSLLLQDNKYFEDSFQIYERGIALFKWPHVKDIWQAYLTQFVERYKGSKLERARDLFKQALEGVCILRLSHEALTSEGQILNTQSSIHTASHPTWKKNSNKLLQITDVNIRRLTCLCRVQTRVYSSFQSLAAGANVDLICSQFVQAPPKESKVLFLQYAALEENYGLARSAMEVYDKAIQTVPQNERLSVYDLYLARASDFFGIAKVGFHSKLFEVNKISFWLALKNFTPCAANTASFSKSSEKFASKCQHGLSFAVDSHVLTTLSCI